MRIMVREMSLIRGLGAPAKEMSFPHHLALFKDHLCLLLPTISRHFPPFPAKKCRKPWWSRNTAVDLAALDVSRALLRDSPAVRLSKRIMNQGLCWRAAQAGPNSEVFTKHETRNTNHGFFRNTAFITVSAQGVAPPETAVRTTASAGKSLFSCSPLFAIVRHCSAKNIVRS